MRMIIPLKTYFQLVENVELFFENKSISKTNINSLSYSLTT